MNRPELRAEERVPVSFAGTLRLGDTTTECVVQNMCSRGFLIRADRVLPVGKVVYFTCELYPGRVVQCTVQVRHVNAGCLGAKVTEMNEDDVAVCRRFLAEQVARNAQAVRADGPGAAVPVAR